MPPTFVPRLNITELSAWPTSRYRRRCVCVRFSILRAPVALASAWKAVPQAGVNRAVASLAVACLAVACLAAGGWVAVRPGGVVPVVACVRVAVYAAVASAVPPR